MLFLVPYWDCTFYPRHPESVVFSKCEKWLFSSQILVFGPRYFKIHQHLYIRSLLYIQLRHQLKNHSFDFYSIFQFLTKTHLAPAYIFVTQIKNLFLVNLKNGLNYSWYVCVKVFDPNKMLKIHFQWPNSNNFDLIPAGSINILKVNFYTLNIFFHLWNFFML